jgi:hypothetical protein
MVVIYDAARKRLQPPQQLPHHHTHNVDDDENFICRRLRRIRAVAMELELTVNRKEMSSGVISIFNGIGKVQTLMLQ